MSGAQDEDVTHDKEYLLDNQQSEAGQRFDALSQLFNPTTFRHVQAIGLAPGWRVWEVGAGSPSVPSWLSAQVGRDGHVLATDIDTSWLESGDAAYELRRHDVGSEPAPSGLFDLVHARLVLVHVARREQALASMVRALRPGGWLLLEDADPALQPLACPDEFGQEQELANKVRHGFRKLLAGRGVDLAYGRTLPRLLRQAGLRQVQSDAYFPMGGSVCSELERATVEQVHDALIASGTATETELRQHLVNVGTGHLDLATSPMVSAWGRKAATE
ncbi:MAG: methyltransferase domain-containing protein [Actinomycetota bacterium]